MLEIRILDKLLIDRNYSFTNHNFNLKISPTSNYQSTMEEQIRRRPKRIGSEEDERIYKEMVEIEKRRMEEEDEAQKKMMQRMEEEKEKMREERQQKIRSKLTDEQRKIRKAIHAKSYRHRRRLAKAANDEKFKQRQMPAIKEVRNQQCGDRKIGCQNSQRSKSVFERPSFEEVIIVETGRTNHGRRDKMLA